MAPNGNTTRTTSEPELPARAGRSTEATDLLAVRCRCTGGVTLVWAFVRNLRTRFANGNGKGTSGSPVRPKVPTRKPGTNCFVVARKRGNSRGAEGGRSPSVRLSQRVTGGTHCLAARRQPFRGGTSRMNREIHVRLCERLRGKFPRPTRRRRGGPAPYADWCARP